MIYNLPRKLLWADKKNISEFLSDELGNEIVSAFSLAVKGQIPDIKLSREVPDILISVAPPLQNRWKNIKMK